MIELPESVWEALADLGEDARTYQYVMIARPSSAGGQLAAMRQELDEERREMSKRLRAVRKKLRQAEEQLAGERVRRELAEAKIKALRGSKAYRAGNAMRKLATPVASARSVVRRRDADR